MKGSKTKKSDAQAISGAGCITLTGTQNLIGCDLLVLCAKNLAAMDSNGKSDPFCKIEANFSTQAFQTHTQKKTLEPVWNESFPMFVYRRKCANDTAMRASWKPAKRLQSSCMTEIWWVKTFLARSSSRSAFSLLRRGTP